MINSYTLCLGLKRLLLNLRLKLKKFFTKAEEKNNYVLQVKAVNRQKYKIKYQKPKGNQITSGCLFSYKKGGFINEFSDM